MKSGITPNFRGFTLAATRTRWI